MEPNKAANELLELLYLQNLDQTGFDDLDLPHKDEAIALLLTQGLVCKDEINLPENIYYYYDLTPAGELAYETGSFKPPPKNITTTSTALKVGFAVGIFGVLLALVFFMMSSK